MRFYIGVAMLATPLLALAIALIYAALHGDGTAQIMIAVIVWLGIAGYLMDGI